MNNNRRKSLSELKDRIEEIERDLEGLKEEEEEYRDNIPENLKNSERYEIADNACDNLEWAISSLEEATNYIESAIE